MPAAYVELRCRSAFSFLDGASLPEDLVAAAAAQDMDVLAIGDRDGVYGAPRFFAAARRAGIQPIVGADVTLATGAPLLLLVESRRGYQNLCRLLTRARAGLQKSEPARTTAALLEEHAAGLIALAGAAPRDDLEALVGAFRADERLCRIAAPLREARCLERTVGDRAGGCLRSRPGGDQRRPLRDGGAAHRPRCPHLCAREAHRRRDRAAVAAE